MKKSTILAVVVAVMGLIGALRAAQPKTAPAACCDGTCCDSITCCDNSVCCGSNGCCDGGACCAAR